MERRNWSAALNSLNQCLQQDPMYADAYYSRAIVLDRLDSVNKALTDYNIYLEFRPEHHEALLARAQLRLRAKQYLLARQDFELLLRTPPGETTAVFYKQDPRTGAVNGVFTSKGQDNAYLYNFIGQASTELGEYVRAIGAYDSALRIDPRDPDVLVNRGIAKAKNTDTTEAILDYQRALVINPQHVVAKHNLALISHGKANSTPSKLLDEAIEENPNIPSAYSERGYRHMKSGDYKSALKDYNEAIRLDSVNEEYFLNRGLVKEKLGDTRGAFSDYTKAIRIKKDFVKAWLNRGNLLSRTGRVSEAVEDYSVAIIYAPDYGAAWYNRAIANGRLKEKERACGDIKEAERLGFRVDGKVKSALCN